jgi:hypothetical protein
VAEISKSGYPVPYCNITNYYINISFHGLKSYNKKIEDKSEQLLKSIVAFINSNNMPEPSLSQFDICTDVACDIEHLVLVCVNRNRRKQYYPLGKYDEDGSLIQLHEGTYEVEKFTRDDDSEKFTTKEELQKAIAKRRANVQKRAILYDKRKKILDKTNYDIGYNLSRFEMKLQARHFSSNKEVSANAFLQELKDYKLLYFENLKQKERFIKRYNKANSNKHRNALVSKVSKTATTIKTNMKNIGEFIRMLDTIKFDAKGRFLIAKKENYLSGTSKFNKKK